MNSRAGARSAVAAAQAPRPLRVGVMVDREYSAHAGGHVKCWERLAEAALDCAGDLDLTVHYLGPKPKTIALGANVRIVHLRPVFSTRRLLVLKQGGGHTDLARHHRRLAAALTGCDVLHATDFFSFGRTAVRLSRRGQQPLVYSAHTDLPKFTQVYTEEIVRRLFGRTPIAPLLLGPLAVHERTARAMRRRVGRGLAHCRHVWMSNPEDVEAFRKLGAPGAVSRLRRGIDLARFDPARRDRERLRSMFGIEPALPVILFVGRVDHTKNVLTLAHAARRLLDQGAKVHTLIVGTGSLEKASRTILGEHVTLAGLRLQEDLTWIYPSADLFAFPSRSELAPNVVLEAKASGLPPVVARDRGGAQFVAACGRDGIVLASDEPEEWASALRGLVDDPARRTDMGVAARRWAEHSCPTWQEVLHEDLLPVWRRVAAASR